MLRLVRNERRTARAPSTPYDGGGPFGESTAPESAATTALTRFTTNSSTAPSRSSRRSRRRRRAVSPRSGTISCARSTVTSATWATGQHQDSPPVTSSTLCGTKMIRWLVRNSQPPTCVVRFARGLRSHARQRLRLEGGPARAAIRTCLHAATDVPPTMERRHALGRAPTARAVLSRPERRTTLGSRRSLSLTRARQGVGSATGLLVHDGRGVQLQAAGLASRYN